MNSQEHRSDPWSGDQIPQAATTRSYMLQQTPSSAKSTYQSKKKKKPHNEKKRNKAIFLKIEKNIPYTRHAKLLAKYQLIEFRTW